LVLTQQFYHYCYQKHATLFIVCISGPSARRMMTSSNSGQTFFVLGSSVSYSVSCIEQKPMIYACLQQQMKLILKNIRTLFYMFYS
jgi:hypothetical protein